MIIEPKRRPRIIEANPGNPEQAYTAAKMRGFALALAVCVKGGSDGAQVEVYRDDRVSKDQYITMLRQYIQHLEGKA